MAENSNNKSTVDTVNNLAGKGKELQRVYGAYKKVRTAMAAGQLAAAAPIAVGVILGVVGFILLFGGGGGFALGGDLGGGGGIPGGGGGGTPQTCISIGGTCQLTTAVCATPNQTYSSTVASCSPDSTGQARICCAPPLTGNLNVVSWAKKISDALTSGCSYLTWYDRLVQTVTNGTYTVPTRAGDCNGKSGGTTTYLCTFLVRDAYKLAGLPGPSGWQVCKQIPQWKALPGYTVQTSNDVRSVRPGDAVFWFDNQINYYITNICIGAPNVARHIDLVYTLTITDPVNGLGKMQTLDANADRKIANYTIRNWKVVMGSPWSFGGVWFGLAP